MTNSVNYWSISSIVLKEEAEKLGLEVDIVSKRKNIFFIKGNQKNILFKGTDFGGNSSLGNKLANDKESTHQILEKMLLPVAKSVFLSKKTFIKFDPKDISHLAFPLIIKPINGAHGNGVLMNIFTFEELTQKLQKSFELYQNMMIQEQISGDEIRVLVVKGEVILAINRVPASIIGDGKHTISELIHQENHNNILRGEGYLYPLTNIKVDDEMLSYISKQGKDMNHILGAYESILLRGNSNIGTGGTMIDITDRVSQDIKNACVKICEIYGLQIAGIDILTKDFTKTLSQSGGIILEVNSNPGIGGDRELTSINTGRVILKKLFFGKI